MLIIFVDQKTEALFNNRSKLQRKYKSSAALIGQRLFELKSADTLADMVQYPHARCEALKHERSGQYSVRVGKVARLIFVPADNPLPLHPGGNVDETRVTSICILCVEDYHDH